MIAFGLKKLAAKYGMNIESGVAYGMVKDCLISLSEGAGYKRLSIYVGQGELPQAGTQASADQIVVAQSSQTPAQSDQTEAPLGQTPAQSDQAPAQHDQTPAQPGQAPAQHDQTPAQPGQTEAPLGQTPAQPGQTPAQLGQTPAQQRADALAERIIELASDYKRYRLMRSGQRLNGIEIEADGSALEVNFFDNPGTLKCVEAFIEEVLPQIAELTHPGECMLCGRELHGDACAALLPGERVVAMDADCIGRVEYVCALHQGGVARGMIGAVVGALIGAALWCAVGLAGYTASIVGMVTALLAGKGYDLLGGRPGKARLICIIACTLVAVVVGDAAALGAMIWREYTQAGAELMQAIGFNEYLGMMIEILIEDGEFVGSVVRDLLLGWLFAIVGCVAVLRKSNKNSDPSRIVRLHGRI